VNNQPRISYEPNFVGIGVALSPTLHYRRGSSRYGRRHGLSKAEYLRMILLLDAKVTRSGLR
jgi:hypothetical protein